VIGWYERTIQDGGRAGAFWLLLALLITFVIVRGITRRIRATDDAKVLRDVSVGGVHIHHLVWGMGLTLSAAFLEFRFQPDGPWLELLAIAFGIGAALMLDEFALVLFMRDVYWTAEGRKSVDAVLITLLVGGLLVLGTSPIELESSQDSSRATLALALGLNALWAAAAVLKGRWLLGGIGMLVPIVAVIAALRLAKPHSPWAHWFYRRRPRKKARSEARFGAAYEARWNRFKDLVGGKPTRPERDVDSPG
jgi:hypothetical protein